jgi:predicted AAA+ superfamily ATPase
MKIPRKKYVHVIEAFLTSSPKSILLLDGPRFAGKSTLLEHIYSQMVLPYKKYYYSFNEHIGTKQFKDSHDFIQFMQIKHGVVFSEPGVLLLNEIQYSKNMGQILHDLVKTHKTKLKIVATSITQ